MTGRERIEAVLCGDIPDCVPFAPNISQWFSYHRAKNTLPEELSGCQDALEAMIVMDCDIFSRRCGGQADLVCDSCPIQNSVDQNNPHLTYYRQETPCGTLANVNEFDPTAWTTYCRKPWWSDWDEYPIIRHIFENSRLDFNGPEWQHAQNRLGEHGIAMVPFAKSPLRHIVQLAGLENGLTWAMIHQPEILQLCQIYTDRALRGLPQVAAWPGVRVVIAMDNLDAAFYPLYIVEIFMRPFFEEAARIMHQAGKYFYIHGCGQTKVNLPILRQMKIDGIEGITHTPLGDIEYHQVRSQAWEGFIIHGGMSCREQEFKHQSQVIEYCKDLFNRMKPFRRFVFSSSCQTSPLTPYENLLTFRDCCREFGRG